MIQSTKEMDKMKKTYDIIIIGGGVAGNSAALGLAKAGKKVAVIENDLWGGTCPNRGCDPKKILLSAVEARNNAKQLIGHGIQDSPAINWPDLIAFKKTYTDPISQNTKENLQSSGIVIYEGTAEFIDSNTVKVNNERLEAVQFIIATGARPSILDIEGKEHILTSRDFLDLSEMPESVTFIGGGYIGFEFAAIANAAGAEVHLIHHNSTPLKEYDQEFVKELIEQLEEDGVIVHLDTDIKLIQQEGENLLLIGQKGFELRTNLVFGATGRLPNVEKLNLEKANVEFAKDGILINEYLQTSNPNIYAMGDVLSKKQPKLTPVASLEAKYLVSVFTDEKEAPIVYPTIPTIVFSNPKLTQIGVTAEEAVNNPNQYELSSIDATNWFSYFRLNEGISKIKIVIDTDSNLLVGASVLNSHADELINLLSILINQKISETELADIIFAYPTIASDLPYFY